MVNYYGPMEARVSLADGTPVTIRQETDYPVGDAVDADDRHAPAEAVHAGPADSRLVGATKSRSTARPFPTSSPEATFGLPAGGKPATR